MAGSIQIDIRNAIKALNKIPKEITKERKKILIKAAKPLKAQAKKNIKKSTQPHHRYKTSKASGKIRTPKGSGQIAATYYPGNLRRSIKTMSFRRSKSAVFVGPKVKKGSAATGVFKGNKVDGYYAAMVERGTINQPAQNYMRNAAQATEGRVIKEIANSVKEVLKDFEAKNKI